jgi:transposase
MEVEVLDQQTLNAPAQAPRGLGGAAATVPGSNRDAEVALINQSMWQAVHERSKAGATVSAIARELDIDRKTVRRCLKQPEWTPYARTVKAPTVLNDFADWIKQRAPQVHYSARILHQELRQLGFAGCYETVKLAVRPLRTEATLDGLTQSRFETEPGQQAQVDWGELTVDMGEQRRVVHVLIMTLGFSRRHYAEGFLNERIPSLLAAHENAFAHFGGCCQTLLYDRMRTVVVGKFKGPDGSVRAKFNDKFKAFADYWGFEPRLCRPYRPKTKGKVESGVKYLKRNFAPGRTFRDLDDFNAQLLAWINEVADVRIHGTTHERPIDRFEREREALIKTGGQPSFLQAMVRERVVAEDWLISVDANRYSVPFGLIGKTVHVIREGGDLVVRHGLKEVARHTVLPGKHQLSIKPEHGPGAAPRNTHRRQSDVAATEPVLHRAVEDAQEVQVRDLFIYEQLAQAMTAEAV